MSDRFFRFAKKTAFSPVAGLVLTMSCASPPNPAPLDPNDPLVQQCELGVPDACHALALKELNGGNRQRAVDILEPNCRGGFVESCLVLKGRTR